MLTDPTHIKIQNYIDKFDTNLKVIEFLDRSTKTCELAADALDVQVAQIAKSLLFMADKKPVIVVTCGDEKVDAKALKKIIGAHKISFAKEDEVLSITGYPVGGVCPLCLPDGNEVKIYIDKSLERFDKVYLAAGTSCSAIPITKMQLLKITGGTEINASIS